MGSTDQMARARKPRYVAPRRHRSRPLLGLGLFPPANGVGPAFLWVARIAVLASLLVFFGLPMLWLMLAPSKTNVQLGTMPPISFGSFSNYGLAFRHLLNYNSGIYSRWIANSFEYVAASVAIGLTLSVLGGYALAIFHFPGRRVILLATLIALIMPSAAFVLPLFLEMNLFHLVNTPLAVILPSGFYPFGVYLSFVYFSTSLPHGIIEAARVDGATERQILQSVAVPLAKPLISLVVFFTFVTQWNNFFLVQVMIYSPERLTLQTGMASLMSGAFFASDQSVPGILRPELALAGMLLAAPVVILFLVIQRYLMAGLLAGYGVG